tara:strand:+ start:821 stop:1012 length:192 start_codon:yes stop_codon:yes gene_type:complete
MMSCNWIVRDRDAKKNDILKFIRAGDSSLEEQVILIHKTSQMNYKQIKNVWLFIPNNYKASAK